MKLLHRRVAAVLSLTLILAFLPGCQQREAAEGAIISAVRNIGPARGFFVTSGKGKDFPPEGASTQLAQQEAITEMVKFAADNKLNSIFFEARPGAAAYYKSKIFPTDASVAVATDTGDKADFDPLAFLCTTAAGYQVQVFAVIDPFSMTGKLPDGAKNPFQGLAVSGDQLDPTDAKLHRLTADGAAELVKNYDLAGVALEGLDASFRQGAGAAAGVEQLTAAVSQAVKKADASSVLAVSFDAANESNAMTVEAVGRLARAGAVDMVIPQMNTTLEHEGDMGYLPLLRLWASADLGTAELYTGNRAAPEDGGQLQNQLLANALEGGVTGAVLSPYSVLSRADPGENELLVSLLAAGATKPVPPELSIPQTLAITYPPEGARLNEKEVYVMGTSDPALPLLMDGKEVPRIGTRGTFGVAVKLGPKDGPCSVKLTQGDKTALVSFSKVTPSGVAAPITKITAASLFPPTPLGVDSNETVELSCVGPSGASISATMAGQTVVMSQSAKAAAGIPVVFKGSVTLRPADYPADKVTNAGKVTYVTSLSGGHEVQSSPAEVFVAGAAVPLTLEIPADSYVASVLTNLSSDDNFTQTLKANGRAAVKGRTTTTRLGNTVLAYKLSSGGYVLGSRANIVADAASCVSDITQITKTEGTDFEQYAFVGGQPAVLTELTDTTLKLRFLDTKMTADPAALSGGLLEKAERTDTADGVELLLTFARGSLWGYDVTHGEGATTLYLRGTPKPSGAFGRPLEGVSILLDPGHGGDDPGALGVAGVTGPTEATLNMAVANAARFRLEQLGATVTMTRADESIPKVTLDERTFQAQREHPHIFLAIHHNSTALNKDLADVRRMEAYYWEHTAKGLADNLMDRLTQTMGRKRADPENAYYYVTRLTFAPAVLFEMGFVVNPAEYEESCDVVSIYKAANGIAMAVVDTIEAGPITLTTPESK